MQGWTDVRVSVLRTSAMCTLDNINASRDRQLLLACAFPSQLMAVA